jgi:DNA-binding transcriptional LysR family regulator
MDRATLSDLAAFQAVAREGSFTRAAAQMGLSQSALSHLIRALEERIGLRLLSRTTRSVAPTEAGAQLLARIGPRLDEIEAALLALGDLRDRPSGSIRLTCSEHAAETVVMPKLPAFLRAWPDIAVEVSLDEGFTDIVTERFDAGIRLGEQVARDMIAVPISPPMRMAVVGTPAYFAQNPPPVVPQDLTLHRCINLRLQTAGGLYAWEFEKAGRRLPVRVSGQLTFNRGMQMVEAALQGLGLCFTPENRVAAALAEGRLIRVLEDWCPPMPGYHLYYPSRRQPSAAFTLFVEALRRG